VRNTNMAFLFRNKNKVVLDVTKSAKELLQKLVTVEQLPQAVRTLRACGRRTEANGAHSLRKHLRKNSRR
jgi:hypothetical protein